MEQMSETTKEMKGEQERIEKRELKQKGLGEELHFVNYWHRKKNFDNFRMIQIPT
jgi:hypothetical protein